MALTVSQKTAKKNTKHKNTKTKQNKKTFLRWVLKIEVCSCAAALKKKNKNNQKQFSLSSFRVSDSFSLYSTPERAFEAYTDDGNI